jgi:alkylation response protein AidB-like acyl-CoA dehydrogenase
MDFSFSDEHLSFQETVRKWVDREAPKAWARRLERDEENYPFELWQKFSDAGFHGIGINEEYGGQGGDVVMQMILGRELARTLGGLAWIWGITSFAGSKSLGIYGSEEHVLGALRTEAKRGDGGWIINGEKIWSSQAHVADYLLLLARTDKQVEKRHQGVSLFWLPTKSPGITVTPLPKLGMRSMGSCSVHFKDVFVPHELVLGEPGRAWYMLLPTLNNERIMVGAFCMGVLDGVLEDALAYMKQRKAFGRIIGEFQVLQHYVADMAIWQQAGSLLLNYTADLQSKGKPCHTESSMLKVLVSDYAVKAADLGIQILGGMGYSAETDMQRYWRDARLWQIGPITNEMARNGIAEALGLPRSF